MLYLKYKYMKHLGPCLVNFSTLFKYISTSFLIFLSFFNFLIGLETGIRRKILKNTITHFVKMSSVNICDSIIIKLDGNIEEGSLI